MIKLSANLERFIEDIQKYLPQHLPPLHLKPNLLHEAMHYSVLNGGKRFRGLLAYAVGQSLGLENLAELRPVAIALELIHAYSLIHDDLPAMDDSPLRRGKPSCHIAFDEATAILAGDALQALAFEVLVAPTNPFSPTLAVKLSHTLAKACGTSGMAGGQALDLQAENQTLTLGELIQLHQLKTGALIEATAEMATLVASATVDVNDDLVESAIKAYAKNLGLAFQIKDDILDVEANTLLIGKPQGLDEIHAKSTFVSLLGLAEAKTFLRDSIQKAIQATTILPRPQPLLELATFTLEREY